MFVKGMYYFAYLEFTSEDIARLTTKAEVGHLSGLCFAYLKLLHERKMRPRWSTFSTWQGASKYLAVARCRIPLFLELGGVEGISLACA